MSPLTTATVLALNLGMSVVQSRSVSRRPATAADQLAASLALAQSHPDILRTCASNVCYSLSIPDQTATSGTGDIYLQLSAPTEYQWVALGQGTQMAGANMFIMYTSSDGSNVTVSPRTTSAEVMPHHDTDAQVTVLEGSGVSNGMMMANIRCSNCQSWTTGTMDLSSGNSNWIYAFLSGTPIKSDDLNQQLTKHDNNGFLTWDVAQARGGDGSNPFITLAQTSGGSGSASNSSSSAPTTNSGTAAVSAAGSVNNNYIIAHGSMATIAFVALYPLGALLVRFASFRGALWVHAGIQVFAYALFIAAAGIGIWTARVQQQLNTHHAIIGMTLLGVLFFMPALGLVHHNRFKVHQSRGIFSYLHIYIGRAAILLGMINGGFGLQLVGVPNSTFIAYGVCVGVVGVAYIVTFIFGEVRRHRLNSASSPSLQSDEAMLGENKGTATASHSG